VRREITTAARKQVLDLDKIHAFIFDMDGVLTETEKQHTKAWKRLFDEYLKKRSKENNEKFKPFTESDYRKYVDGKPRYAGVKDFLKSRKISLPEGSVRDSPDKETIYGLGNKKDRYFHGILRKEGAEVYKSSIDFIREIEKRGLKCAVISSSKNTVRILEATHIEDLFALKVDGNDLEKLKIPGKPDPAMFLEAAKRLRVDPSHAAIVEDSLAGVEAGKRGKFGLVIGMVHEHDDRELLEHGADVAVGDLRKLLRMG
jgi:beta-phosphoglucomutase family hydrolase